MSVIQFESVVEGDVIRIPEQYIDQIPARVAVTIVDVEKPRLKPKTRKELPSVEVASPTLVSSFIKRFTCGVF